MAITATITAASDSGRRYDTGDYDAPLTYDEPVSASVAATTSTTTITGGSQ